MHWDDGARPLMACVEQGLKTRKARAPQQERVFHQESGGLGYHAHQHNQANYHGHWRSWCLPPLEAVVLHGKLQHFPL